MEFKREFNMCRLCLCESESFIDIFQVNEWFGYVAADVIRDLLQFQVSETDGYPHVICSICLGKLTDFKRFKQQCQNSRHTYDNLFMSYEARAEHPADIVPSGTIKVEPEEGTDDVVASTEEDLNPAKREEEEIITDDVPSQMALIPVKLEPKDSSDTLEAYQEVSSAFIKRELEEGTNYVDATNEIRKRSKQESYSDEEEGRERERGGDAPLGVDEGVGKGERFRCHDCGKKCANKDVLIRHLKVHGYTVREERCSEQRDLDVNINGRPKCVASEIHGKGFERNASRKVKTDGGFRRFVCELCDKGFKWLRDMKNHSRVHTGEKPFACSFCEKRFNDKSNLRKHELIHGVEKPYVCEVCGRPFLHESDFDRHRRSHGGEKTYVCDVCGKSFRHGNVLKRHVRVHTGERPYGCEICGKTFAASGSLTCHRRVHSGEKPYKCEVCEKCFSVGSSLRKHLRIHLR